MTLLHRLIRIMIASLLGVSVSISASDKERKIELLDYIKSHTDFKVSADPFNPLSFRVFNQTTAPTKDLCTISSKKVSFLNNLYSSDEELAELASLNPVDISSVTSFELTIVIYTNNREPAVKKIETYQVETVTEATCNRWIENPKRKTHMSGNRCVSEYADNNITFFVRQGYREQVLDSLRQLITLCGGVTPSPSINRTK